MQLPDPAFPPLLNGRIVAPGLQPFEAACQAAASGELGAADILWSEDTETADCAIILEPDVPLGQCLQLVPMSMIAMAEALAVLCPPKVAVEFRWPGDIIVNGAKGGDVRLAASHRDCSAVPQWLVVAMRLRLVDQNSDQEPGERLDTTCLAEEGGEELLHGDVLASLGSHFLMRLNGWQDDGFAGLHDQWLFRSIGRDKSETFGAAGQRQSGKVLGLDEEAGLLLKDGEAPARVLPVLPHVFYLDDRQQLRSDADDAAGALE